MLNVAPYALAHNLPAGDGVVWMYAYTDDGRRRTLDISTVCKP